MDSTSPKVALESTSASTSPPPRDSEIVKTPCPYEQDKMLNLSVTKTWSDEIRPGDLAATVTKVCSMTMSPVVECSFTTTSGATKKAALKVFNRRFGQSFRHIRGIRGKFPGTNRYLPHTSAVEEHWRDYVREGKASAFFDKMKERHQRQDALPPCPEEFLEAMAPECYARFEGALSYQALAFFDAETQAYERLSDLQGQGIPKLLAHVRLRVEHPDAGVRGQEEEPADAAEFFQINGIAMEPIDGCPLSKLTPSIVPTDKLEGVLQRTIDIATKINMRGVILGDCRPGNVLVETGRATPFVHDFAQSWTWDTSDEEFGLVVCENQNPRRIVTGLAGRWQQAEGKEIKMNLDFSELYKSVGLTEEEAEENWQIMF